MVAAVEGGNDGFVGLDGFPGFQVEGLFDEGGDVGGGLVLGEVEGEEGFAGAVFDDVECGGVGGAGVVPTWPLIIKGQKYPSFGGLPPQCPWSFVWLMSFGHLCQ